MKILGQPCEFQVARVPFDPAGCFGPRPPAATAGAPTVSLETAAGTGLVPRGAPAKPAPLATHVGGGGEEAADEDDDWL